MDAGILRRTVRGKEVAKTGRPGFAGPVPSGSTVAAIVLLAASSTWGAGEDSYQRLVGDGPPTVSGVDVGRGAGTGNPFPLTPLAFSPDGAADRGEPLLAGYLHQAGYTPAQGQLWLAGMQDGDPRGAGTLPLDTLPNTSPPGTVLSSAGPPTLMDQAKGSTFYARIDWFYWRETSGSTRWDDESGALATLGFLQRSEDTRLRLEIFGGEVNYDGQTMIGTPFTTYTSHFGFQGQYDLLWGLRQDPDSGLTLGLGTRLWNRKIADGTDQAGNSVEGYDETWWTVYPCIGLETRGALGTMGQWFGTANFGVTVFTLEHVPAFSVDLYPKPGPLVQAELGIQTQRFLLSAYLQMMQFYTSDTVGGYNQPDSLLLTIGLNGGVRF
jgi:hypothetical protein